MGFFDFLGQKTAQPQRRPPLFGFQFSQTEGTSPFTPIVVSQPTDMTAARARFREYYAKASPFPEAAVMLFLTGPDSCNVEALKDEVWDAFNDEMMFGDDKIWYLEEHFGGQGLRWSGVGLDGMDATGGHKQTIAFRDGRKLTLYFDLSALAFRLPFTAQTLTKLMPLLLNVGFGHGRGIVTPPPRKGLA